MKESHYFDFCLPTILELNSAKLLSFNIIFIYVLLSYYYTPPAFTTHDVSSPTPSRSNTIRFDTAVFSQEEAVSLKIKRLATWRIMSIHKSYQIE